MTYHISLSGGDPTPAFNPPRERLEMALNAARICQRNWPKSQRALRWVGVMLDEYANMPEVRGRINTRDALGGAQKYIEFAVRNPPEYARYWLQAIVALIEEQIKLHDRGGRDEDGNFIPLDHTTIR